jgi:hypothetical protein
MYNVWTRNCTFLQKSENTNILAQMFVGSRIDFHDWNVGRMLMLVIAELPEGRYKPSQ